MINIDFKSNTYTCPYCQKEQTFSCSSYSDCLTGLFLYHVNREEYKKSDIVIYHIQCSNQNCKEITVVGKSSTSEKQFDLIPENVVKQFPNYIPKPILEDYTEAVTIIDKSPKAAATLFRRCLQGMIHDFWKIYDKNLNIEISKLQGKISDTQWKAIDGLRKIGNIGAHMEHDVNEIIDIESNEAIKLQKVIELLIEKWYINRYEEDKLYTELTELAEEKISQRGKSNETK